MSEMLEDLVDSIWARPEFHTDYKALVLASLRKTTQGGAASWMESKGDIDAERPASGTIDQPALGRLLQTSTHFASSNRTEFREVGYRIAVAALNVASDSGAQLDHVREIVHVVLGRLGNFPGIQHLFHGVDPLARGQQIPLLLWLALQSHEQANVVAVGSELSLTLTDFQRDLWNRLSLGRSTAINAPTSAGKSYALEHFLAMSLSSGGKRWAVYVVPTRALINQVSSDLLETARQIPGAQIPIVTIPIAPADLGMSSGIYVLTQERLQLLLETDPTLNFDLAVIDEAQMLAESSRGVILQTVIEEIVRRSKDTQLFFAAPLAKDTSVFGKIFGIEVDSVPRPERPVTQNLIFLTSDSILRAQIDVDVMLDGARLSVGRLALGTELFGPEQMLATLSHVLGAGEKNLIYAGSKSRCEDIASRLRQLAQPNMDGLEGFRDLSSADQPSPNLDVDTKAARDEFASFVKQNIHPDYALAATVPFGIGFHYGNMPALIRKTVEDLFAAGRLDHLVCTSTLLHGVNLPAKNLFLSNPTKGRERGASEDTPISSHDFWNLAGRAGRLGKEFEGNVFLIDYSKWQSQPMEEEKEESIVPSLTRTLTQNAESFLAFVRNREHASGADSGAENALVKLVNSYRAGRLPEALSRIFGETSAATIEILEAVREAVDAINVPSLITERNITVSIFRQQEMLDYLIGRIRDQGPRRVIPIHPARPWNECYPSLLRVFKRIHGHFEKLPTGDGSHKFFAPLALLWMKGEPLPKLIDNAIKFRLKKHPNAKKATIIRDTLDDIENDLRFRYVKFTSCYQDLAAEALRRTGHEEFVDSIPTLSFYLELGASSRTMISLVGLGLSRTTAGLISGKANNLGMERPETRRWLETQPWSSMDLSPICVREINRVLGASAA